MLNAYWEPSLVAKVSPSNESFYTTLLVSGVNTMGTSLSEKLSTIRKNLEQTISHFFSDLQLSQAAFHEATPFILRVLPRLISCLKLITQSEIQWRVKEKILKLRSQDSRVDYMNWLKHFLLLPTKEMEEDKERLHVLEGLRNSLIPVELLVLIREIRVAKLLAAHLVKAYPLLNLQIVNYIVEDGMAYPRAYSEFYQGILKHHWTEPYLVDKQQLNAFIKRETIDESSTSVSKSLLP